MYYDVFFGSGIDLGIREFNFGDTVFFFSIIGLIENVVNGM